MAIADFVHDGRSADEPALVAAPTRSRGAGRRFVPPSAGGAHGLWLVNQLCDLVELRSHRNRTTVRVHLRVDGQPGAAALSEAAAPPCRR